MFVFILCMISIGVLIFLLRDNLFVRNCTLRQRLDSQVIIVTGCNTGIGLETVAELARRGARVYMACRDLNKCEQARLLLLKRYGINQPDACSANLANPYLGHSVKPINPDQLICEKLDLSSVESIRNFAERFRHRESTLNILINNAGVMQSGYSVTEHKFEFNMGVNHLGHFLLTNLLLPSLKAAGSSKVINVSSDSHYMARLNPDNLNAPFYGSYYANSKLANVIHAVQLSKRFESNRLTAVSLHPGLVGTELFRQPTFVNACVKYLPKPFLKSPWQGAQTTLYCALCSNLVPGGYYKNCRQVKPNKQALDDEVGDRLWNTSEELLSKV